MPEFVLNAAARIDVADQGGNLEVSIRAPIQGQEIRITKFSAADHPASVELLRRLAEAPQSDTLSELEVETLKECGLLISAPVPVLDIDIRFVRGWLPTGVRFEDPYSSLGNPPVRIPEKKRLIWLHDPIRRVWLPYTLTADELAALEGPPRDVGIFESEGFVLAKSLWPMAMEQARESLDRKGYGVVPGLLPQCLLRAAANYYSQLKAAGLINLGDAQSVRYSAHREPLAEWLHFQVAEVLEPLFQGRFKKSYSYVAGYVGGAELPKHTDRAQCEITVSICVDASPGAQRWPLYLESGEQQNVIELRLASGNAVLFQGRKLPHWRNALPMGEQFLSLLFHFVPADFEGVLD